MRDYEVVYIFHPALEEAQIGEKLDRFQGLATADGGQVTEVDHWGKRELAYEIADQTSGYYVVSHLNADPTKLPEFERVLKLDDELLRYLVVINEGNLSTRPSMPEVERDEDEDDEDEED